MTHHTENTSHPEQYDALTTLPNRALFNEALNKAISYAKRHDKVLALLLINLDQFENINADQSPTVGDMILKTIAERFKKVLRTEDTLARLDGDEFVILLHDIVKPKFASVVAEKILRACAEPIQECSVTASIGISVYPQDGSSLEDLLGYANDALYRAKNAGGNVYQFHTEELHLEANEYIQLGTALRNAIQNNELVLYYQPKLHIKKGNLIGVEALIRWVHPEFGMIQPAKFLLLAEETGLIIQLGEWVLREACKTNKYWQNEGYEHIVVAVNLSEKQFQHPDLVKTINGILKETNLNPQYLELEINESSVMSDIETAAKKLDAIKTTGVQITIDHFGTGYTSISYLKRFPLSTIKIDQSFIIGVPNNPNDSAITNAFIALAHHLGMEAVAEGVETAEQVEYLTEQNCDIIQGYFISYPLPAKKIEQQLKKLMDRTMI
ncbi:MAG: diguanylate cyclase/phosphodiesterase with PAS/PAC sensor(s) [uncultured bacterium]|nr:MAG: diguanylate cyclase/phosphodiesterase with PAS/PAC sensor(s) [uncultured bacterium]